MALPLRHGQGSRLVWSHLHGCAQAPLGWRSGARRRCQARSIEGAGAQNPARGSYPLSGIVRSRPAPAAHPVGCWRLQLQPGLPRRSVRGGGRVRGQRLFSLGFHCRVDRRKCRCRRARTGQCRGVGRLRQRALRGVVDVQLWAARPAKHRVVARCILLGRNEQGAAIHRGDDAKRENHS